MPSSQKTPTKNETLSGNEVVKILAQVLAKAKKFSGPALLMVEFPTEYTRKETAEELAKTLKEANDELIDIDLRKPINLLEIIEELKPNQVGSVHGLHAQPEVVRRLNWGRERLTDNNKRIVFWLNFEELKDLAERAPDFWAFRNRQLKLAGVIERENPYLELNYHESGYLELSNLPLNSKKERVEALEELCANTENLARWMMIKKDLAILYADLGDYKKSIQNYGQILAVSREFEDKQREAETLVNIGTIFLELGEETDATKFYDQALEVSDEIGDKSIDRTVFGNLGLIHLNQEKINEAIDYFERSLSISKSLLDKQGESVQLGNLGLAYSHLGKFKKAIKYHQQALILTREIGDKDTEVNHLANLGSIYTNLGELDKAISCLKQALGIAREIGNRAKESGVLNDLGLAYADLGNTEESIQIFKQALEVSREIGNRHGEASDLNNLGLAYADLEESKKCLACFVVSLALFMDIQSANIQKMIENINLIRLYEPKFVPMLSAIFSNSDTILQEATEQNYSFFRSNPSLGTATRITSKDS
jgi:tetratricopeptide (TPR) repeat protein